MKPGPATSTRSMIPSASSIHVNDDLSNRSGGLARVRGHGHGDVGGVIAMPLVPRVLHHEGRQGSLGQLAALLSPRNGPPNDLVQTLSSSSLAPGQQGVRLRPSIL